MAETDAAAGSSSHVVIDVDAVSAAKDADEAAEATSSSCAVCMEAMEWVAVSPCGHCEVCARCAARIRFFHNDRRRCICRSCCATVVVTKASNTATTQREPDGGFPFLWPPLLPAAAVFGGQGLVVAGVHYWYHRGMGAYFDDVSQYQEMSKVCSTTPASTGSEESGGAGAAAGGVNHQPPAAIVNVVSAPARQVQADADVPLDEVDRPLSQEETASLVLGVAMGLDPSHFLFGWMD